MRTKIFKFKNDWWGTPRHIVTSHYPTIVVVEYNQVEMVEFLGCGIVDANVNYNNNSTGTKMLFNTIFKN